jgi:hypothetical protein
VIFCSLVGKLFRGLQHPDDRLTDAVSELHADDAALVALVLAGAVAVLGDPAFGRPVRRAGVHEPVHHQQADHRVRVAVHHLIEVAITHAPWYRGLNTALRRRSEGVHTLVHIGL